MAESSVASSDVLKKLEVAKEKKETADHAFKAGELQKALLSYHEALMYIKGIDKNALKAFSGNAAPSSGAVDDAANQQPKTEADEMLEKIYSNMSACHIKNKNWKRAIETADKALEINPKNYKAFFRKAKALGEQGFFEKAEKILEDLLQKNPSDSVAVSAELSRLRAIDREREKVHNQKFKGFLNREPKKSAAE